MLQLRNANAGTTTSEGRHPFRDLPLFWKLLVPYFTLIVIIVLLLWLF